jgi:hypothetical protein
MCVALWSRHLAPGISHTRVLLSKILTPCVCSVDEHSLCGDNSTLSPHFLKVPRGKTPRGGPFGVERYFSPTPPYVVEFVGKFFYKNRGVVQKILCEREVTRGRNLRVCTGCGLWGKDAYQLL